MKKSIKIIVLVIIVIAIVGIISVATYRNSKYSIESIISIIEPEDNKLPDNLYIKAEDYDKDNQLVSISETYIKNNVVYIKTEHSESIYDIENKKTIDINNELKDIHCNVLDYDIPYLNSYSFCQSVKTSAKDNKYKYLGTEKIDNREYLKFAIFDKNSEDYFYIDLDQKKLVKIESFDENKNKISTGVITYEEGVVKDEDILKFDINNYPDYRFTDSTVEN